MGKRKKKTKMQRTRDEADALWQKVIKTAGRCIYCEQSVQVGHHFFPKSVSNRLRYDIKNGIPLCNGCHNRHHAAGDPRIHNKVIFTRGIKWLKYLEEAQKEHTDVNTEWYEKNRERLKKLLDKTTKLPQGESAVW